MDQRFEGLLSRLGRSLKRGSSDDKTMNQLISDWKAGNITSEQIKQYERIPDLKTLGSYRDGETLAQHVHDGSVLDLKHLYSSSYYFIEACEDYAKVKGDYMQGKTGENSLTFPRSDDMMTGDDLFKDYKKNNILDEVNMYRYNTRRGLEQPPLSPEQETVSKEALDKASVAAGYARIAHDFIKGHVPAVPSWDEVLQNKNYAAFLDKPRDTIKQATREFENLIRREEEAQKPPTWDLGSWFKSGREREKDD